jgi:hypothetical protein
MTPQEQQGALADAGFVHVHVDLEMGSLVLYVGERVA